MLRLPSLAHLLFAAYSPVCSWFRGMVGPWFRDYFLSCVIESSLWVFDMGMRFQFPDKEKMLMAMHNSGTVMLTYSNQCGLDFTVA